MKKEFVIIIKAPYLFFILCIFSIFLASCCCFRIFGSFAKGPEFYPIEQVPEGKALIYIYREEKYMGSANIYYLYANGKIITTIRSGGYFSYFEAPGQIVFSTDPAMGGCLRYTLCGLLIGMHKGIYEKIIINVDPGKIYYLKLFIKFGGWEIIQVSNLVGEQEIAKCRLLESKQIIYHE